MSFLYASLLAGLAGLLAPIIIHLIARNKFPVQEFPGTWLLRAERRDNVFAARLVDPLQLLIRLLVIALLVVAMSRPFLPSDGLAPRNLVVVIDTSASMKMKTADESGNEFVPFESAKKVAIDLFNEVKQPSRCALILSGDRNEIAAGWSSDPSAALDILKDAEPGDGGGQGIATAVAQAVEMVRGRYEIRSQILVLSDLTKSAFATQNQRDLAAIKSIKENMGEKLEIVFVDVSGTKAENLGIVHSELRGGLARIGDDAHIFTKIKNFGKKRAETRLSLSIPGVQEAPKTDFSLEPDEEIFIDLTARVDRSARTFAAVAINAKDAIQEDNQFRVPFVVGNSRRLLLVNGSADKGKTLSAEDTKLAALGGGGVEMLAEDAIDGARILQFALNPGRELGLAFGTGFDTTQITTDALPAQTLSKYDTIILYDVSSLQDQALVDLDTFVREGKSLIIFCSGALDPMKFNSTLGSGGSDRLPLSPVQIGNDRQLKEPERISLESSSQVLGDGVTFEPGSWLAPFKNVGSAELSVIRFEKLREVRTIEKGANVLMNSEQGQPIVIEAQRDSGRVILFAFGVELSRGNIAMAKAFPPLMWRLLDYATGRLRITPPDTLVASRPSVLDASDTAFRFVDQLQLRAITERSNRQNDSEGEQDESDAERILPLPISAQKTALVAGLPAGNYWLEKPGKTELNYGVGYRRPISVNHDPGESSLEQFGDKALKKVFGEGVQKVSTAQVTSLAPKGFEAWRILLLILTLVYLAEGISSYLLSIKRDKEFKEGLS
ncbi:MAG: BatA and WFA domain-containing protein [Planctomycetota bacterium]|nr:BatA and WFA domain-containing protein [Planctomycetota bacterium]